MKVAFVEQKIPNFSRIESLLEKSRQKNRWANCGPLYSDLANALSSFASLNGDAHLLPVANGGIALEAMARFLSFQAGKRLRWVASAFSFSNIGRGYFHDVTVLDCDTEGLLDLSACKRLDPDSFDGLIVTNPFGLHRKFDGFAEFADLHKKKLLIDNAAGFHAFLPDLMWQAFSLHHTKPFGVGEGGAALVPKATAKALYEFIDYAGAHDGSEHWLGNGKISDISCAFLIDRLERSGDWLPLYIEQRERVMAVAAKAGYESLAKPQDGLPMTSLPLLAPSSVPNTSIHQTKFLTLGKYYKPLRKLPKISGLFERIVNVPCHPDVSRLSDAQIAEDLIGVLETRRTVSK